MSNEAVRSILFVCLGNICRSPIAAGVMRSLVADAQPPIAVDSAGVGPWHVGKAPDGRAIATAQRRGVDLADDRARMLAEDDFRTFDLILAMDAQVLADVWQRAPADATAQIGLFRKVAEDVDRDVDDPYYGGDDGFERVYDEIETAAKTLLENLPRN
ncbi:low molecular weight protein-tyrosine-phosphatase [Amorphus coralli]|uniref:low molecular weight protein-tyrosine-phosphatase n=1 Tax=Amorphus coralli TaxID=340680 RepID=UPI000379535E|nr:low molecular weight protein-tyrosine-phosphatase [Amorphus coralli]